MSIIRLKITPSLLDHYTALPKAKRAYLLALSQQVNHYGSQDVPYADKINEKHIDKILDIDRLEIEQNNENKKSDRAYNLAYVLIFVASAGILTYFLAEKNPNMLFSILQIVAGGFGGYGWALSRKQKDKS